MTADAEDDAAVSRPRSAESVGRQSSSDTPLVLPEAPHAVQEVFGDRRSQAEQFARHLADTGVSHGLIGPREVVRLWERHLLNCAVIAELMSPGASVIDVGSGAGLPGLALAIARPDLDVTLIEPMERRTRWLTSVAEDLALHNVSVVRARAEEMHGRLTADVVTARAVAALDRLAGWCLPLTAVGGRLIAMKGSSAQREIEEARPTIERLGGAEPTIRTCGGAVLETPTTVVVIDRIAEGRPRVGSGTKGDATGQRASRARRRADASRGRRRP